MYVFLHKKLFLNAIIFFLPFSSTFVLMFCCEFWYVSIESWTFIFFFLMQTLYFFGRIIFVIKELTFWFQEHQYLFWLALSIYIYNLINSNIWSLFFIWKICRQDFEELLQEKHSSLYTLRITINRNFNMYIVYTAAQITTIVNPYGEQIY